MRAPQILLMLSLAPATIVAQSTTASWPLESGSRVRIQTAVFNKPKIGTVVAAQGDTLVFRAPKDATANPIGVNDITRLDISQGSHTRRLRGLLIGFTAGAVVAGAIGAATYKESTCFACIDFGRWGDAALLGTFGGMIGSIAGLVVGSSQTETWVPVALPRR